MMAIHFLNKIRRELNKAEILEIEEEELNELLRLSDGEEERECVEDKNDKSEENTYKIGIKFKNIDPKTPERPKKQKETQKRRQTNKFKLPKLLAKSKSIKRLPPKTAFTKPKNANSKLASK
jgi:hypothetical protein